MLNPIVLRASPLPNWRSRVVPDPILHSFPQPAQINRNKFPQISIRPVSVPQEWSQVRGELGMVRELVGGRVEVARPAHSSCATDDGAQERLKRVWIPSRSIHHSPREFLQRRCGEGQRMKAVDCLQQA